MSFVANALTWMAEPWFAIPWYVVGVIGALWIVYDSLTANSALNPPLKVCWPILVFFFSIIGIALYLVTSRPSDIAAYHGREDKMRRFTEYSKPRCARSSPRRPIASAATVSAS